MNSQDSFKEAFNSGWERYDRDEELAQRVTWASVKQKLHKNDDGEWVAGASDDA